MTSLSHCLSKSQQTLLLASYGPPWGFFPIQIEIFFQKEKGILRCVVVGCVVLWCVAVWCGVLCCGVLCCVPPCLSSLISRSSQPSSNCHMERELKAVSHQSCLLLGSVCLFPWAPHPSNIPSQPAKNHNFFHPKITPSTQPSSPID